MNNNSCSSASLFLFIFFVVVVIVVLFCSGNTSGEWWLASSVYLLATWSAYIFQFIFSGNYFLPAFCENNSFSIRNSRFVCVCVFVWVHLGVLTCSCLSLPAIVWSNECHDVAFRKCWWFYSWYDQQIASKCRCTGVHARLKCEMHFYAKMKDGKQNKTKRSTTQHSKAKQNRTISLCIASPAIAAVVFVGVAVVGVVRNFSALWTYLNPFGSVCYLNPLPGNRLLICRIFFVFSSLSVSSFATWFASHNPMDDQRWCSTVFGSLFAQWALAPLCHPHVVSFPTTVVPLRRHRRRFALHSEAITMQTGIVLMLSSFYCHHQNVTTPLSLLSCPLARSLALPCSFRTPFMSLHSFECYLQGINFDILCQKILFSFIFGIMQKCSQELTWWVFSLGIECFPLFPFSFSSFEFSEWEMTSTTKVSLHSTVRVGTTKLDEPRWKWLLFVVS